jgi:hypothetical protein
MMSELPVFPKDQKISFINSNSTGLYKEEHLFKNEVMLF